MFVNEKASYVETYRSDMKRFLNAFIVRPNIAEHVVVVLIITKADQKKKLAQQCSRQSEMILTHGNQMYLY